MPSSRTSKSQPPKSERAAMGVKDRGDTPQSEQRIVAIAAISVPLTQPRRYFEPTKMQQLIESIKTHGILENLLVRPIPGKDGLYELIAGERRFRAAIEAGLSEVPVSVRNMSDLEAVQYALTENLQREDLNPVEETDAILQLLALGLDCPAADVPSVLYRLQKEAKGQRVAHNVMGHKEAEVVESVFTSISRMSWESFTTNRLPLLYLPCDILEALRQGRIEYTKAKALARLESPSKRQELLEEAIAKCLSVSEIRQRLKQLNCSTESATLSTRVEAAYKRLKKYKVWENPQKREQLESVLAQLEALVT